MITTSRRLRYEGTQPGSGATAGPRTTCVMDTGQLCVSGPKRFKFDGSLSSGNPFSFIPGAGRGIEGWDEGVASGTSTSLIPPDKLLEPR